ncbi:hypothetical protein VTN02DRAFT_6250 [Thermoascus thermophilus]
MGLTRASTDEGAMTELCTIRNTIALLLAGFSIDHRTASVRSAKATNSCRAPPPVSPRPSTPEARNLDAITARLWSARRQPCCDPPLDFSSSGGTLALRSSCAPVLVLLFTDLCRKAKSLARWEFAPWRGFPHIRLFWAWNVLIFAVSSLIDLDDGSLAFSCLLSLLSSKSLALFLLSGNCTLSLLFYPCAAHYCHLLRSFCLVGYSETNWCRSLFVFSQVDLRAVEIRLMQR